MKTHYMRTQQVGAFLIFLLLAGECQAGHQSDSAQPECMLIFESPAVEAGLQSSPQSMRRLAQDILPNLKKASKGAFLKEDADALSRLPQLVRQYPLESADRASSVVYESLMHATVISFDKNLEHSIRLAGMKALVAIVEDLKWVRKLIEADLHYESGSDQSGNEQIHLFSAALLQTETAFSSVFASFRDHESLEMQRLAIRGLVAFGHPFYQIIDRLSRKNHERNLRIYRNALIQSQQGPKKIETKSDEFRKILQLIAGRSDLSAEIRQEARKALARFPPEILLSPSATPQHFLEFLEAQGF